jgi:aminoglycoside phosphotransferase (APT) family kinase protein
MTAPQWAAEVAIDETLVRSLIEDQFPDLAGVPLRLLAEGWDNAVWVAGDDLILRFPRRSIAIPGVEREIRVLPRLAPLLPVSIPVPVRVGRAGSGYPWPFFGARLLAGVELPEAGLPDSDRIGVATALGSFLRQLHDPAVATASFVTDLPVDPMGRADMAVRVDRALDGLAEVEAARLWTAPRALRGALESARALPASTARAVLHGDLHVRHLLVLEGALSGVIDWGDLCIGDPSIDLSVGRFAFSGDARRAFLETYGDVPVERAARARVLAVFLSSTLATYADREGLAGLRDESLRGLERTLEGLNGP